MKITIEPTEQLVEVVSEAGRVYVNGRIWQGKTSKGLRVQLLVVRVAADALEDLDELEEELAEQPAPTPAIPIFPLRFIL